MYIAHSKSSNLVLVYINSFKQPLRVRMPLIIFEINFSSWPDASKRTFAAPIRNAYPDVTQWYVDGGATRFDGTSSFS